MGLARGYLFFDTHFTVDCYNINVRVSTTNDYRTKLLTEQR